MMSGERIKPDMSLFFAKMPIIGIFLKSDYDKVMTVEDMVKIFHKWTTIADTTHNTVKRDCYKASANYLYSYLTNKSYDSTNFKTF